MDAVERYEFHIKGRLSDSLCRAFEDSNSAIKLAETVMRGEVRDQSELHGVLELIESLGLELVELRHLEPKRAPSLRPQLRRRVALRGP